MSLPADPDASLIEDSVRYLASDAALASLAGDCYWPKWDSPWWHMLLLHEMGQTAHIPQRAAEAMVAALNASPPIFPIRPEDLPAGVDPMATPCHCALGCMYQVLAARGVDVDRELPWIRPWFLRYQMADGGLNCDTDAYLVQDECPSSMVGTIAPLEAVLLYTPRPWTPEETEFLRRAAGFLIERRLHRGSPTRHNREERDAARSWAKLCFPRFYFYDVLRGLRALLLWAAKTGARLPASAVTPIATYLERAFPEGMLRIGRCAYEGKPSRQRLESGAWVRGQPASYFPLLAAVSAVGASSPYLTRQWQECRDLLARVPLRPEPEGDDADHPIADR